MCVNDDEGRDLTCGSGRETPGDKRPADPGGNPGTDPVESPGNNPVITPPVNQDLSAPRLRTWQRHNPRSATTDADVLTWRLTFNEPVTGVSTNHFRVRINGSTRHSATHRLSGSGSTWRVTVSGGGIAELNGTVQLSFRSKRGIADRAGNAFTNTTPLNGSKETTYTLRNAAPPEKRFNQGEAALSQQSRNLGMAAVGVVSGRGSTPTGSSLTLAGRTVPLGGLAGGASVGLPGRRQRFL